MIWTRELLLEVVRSQPERLVELVLQFQEQNVNLHTELAQSQQQLRDRNQELSQQAEQLAAAQRAAFRQAAPFRKPPAKRVSERKKPGRKAGHKGSCRPRPKHIDQTTEVPLCQCPDCAGTNLIDRQLVEQFIAEIPPVRPVIELPPPRVQVPNNAIRHVKEYVKKYSGGLSRWQISHMGI